MPAGRRSLDIGPPRRTLCGCSFAHGRAQMSEARRRLERLLAVQNPKRSNADVRLMVRVAQLYYRLHLSQAEIGERVGLSRFQVGRLLDRAVEDEIVRIAIVHPDARLVELEDALTTRFGLDGAAVADVPAASQGHAADDV